MTGIIERIEVVDADMIEPMPIRIRKMVSEEFEFLKKSIEDVGYVEPIQVCYYSQKTDLVVREPPFYLIVNGQHRFDALVNEFKADKVTVVVLGENWDKIKYWSEAIRLNNIKGDYDIERLADRIRELKKSIPDWNELREILAFGEKDKIFKSALGFLSKIDREKAFALSRKIERGEISLESLPEILKEFLSGLRGENYRGIIVTSPESKLLMFQVDDDCFEKLKKIRNNSDIDYITEFRKWVYAVWSEYLFSDDYLKEVSVKSPLAYAGGTHFLYSKVLRLIPEHEVYVEPFGGSAKILFAKKPAVSEVYNDINGDLVNFFRVLRDEEKCKKLYNLLLLTPYSREEFEDAKKMDEAIDDVERARRFFVLSRQSYIGSLKDWSTSNSVLSTYFTAISGLPIFHARLRNVKIEHGDFETVIRRYDSEKTFFFVDPPYVGTSESYTHLKFSLDDHRRLVRVLKEIRGKAMLLGYDNEIYKDLEENGWAKLSFPITVNTLYKQNRAGGRNYMREECIWLNYEVDGVG